MKLSLGLCAVALAFGAFACGGQANGGPGVDPAADPSSEDALTSAGVDLSAAVAVEIEIKPVAAHFDKIKVTLGSPKKLQKVAKGIKKNSQFASPPRCMPAYTTDLKFVDAEGKEVASTSIMCGWGRLSVAGGEEITIKSGADFKEIAELPLVPGDALWGISEVEVNKVREHDKKTVSDADQVKKLVDAIDLEQKIDGNRPMPRCLPTYSVAFKRKNKDVAYTSFMCGDADGSSVHASFQIPGATANADDLANGAVELDPRPFRKVFE